MNIKKTLLSTALAVSLIGSVAAETPTVSNTSYTVPSTSDLLSYSHMNMDVYKNSRVTSIEGGLTSFVVKGYMFENGSVNASYNTSRNWREIVFVNTEDTSTSKAYRKQVQAVYNTWLNKNMTATQNGQYDLRYANYSVTVATSNMNSYVGNVAGQSMKPGVYYVYMRISNGTTSYLFPLRDITLTDGTNMENTGKLPYGFNVYDEDTRALTYTVEGNGYVYEPSQISIDAGYYDNYTTGSSGTNESTSGSGITGTGSTGSPSNTGGSSTSGGSSSTSSGNTGGNSSNSGGTSSSSGGNSGGDSSGTSESGTGTPVISGTSPWEQHQGNPLQGGTVGEGQMNTTGEYKCTSNWCRK